MSGNISQVAVPEALGPADAVRPEQGVQRCGRPIQKGISRIKTGYMPGSVGPQAVGDLTGDAFQGGVIVI
jgi:hypothetical protein